MAESTDRTIHSTPEPVTDDAGERTLPPGPGPAVARPPGDARSVEPARPRTDAPARARTNGRPAGPDDMRREIEATRARMSETLDELEALLAHEKQELERKADDLWAKVTLQGVRRKISEEPYRSMAIAFVAGYVIAAIRD